MDGFELWLVRPEGGNSVGYLVTDRERCPNPIAFLRHATPGQRLTSEHALARAVQRGEVEPGTRGTVDLRGDGWWRRCPDVLNVRLDAIDDAGEPIGNRARFTSGQFILPPRYEAPAFLAMVRADFQPAPRTIGQQKSGTSKTPRLPLSGIVRETKAMATTAA